MHDAPQEEDRRDFLTTTAAAAMAGGLVASYGTLGTMAGEFLFPAHGTVTGWQFVAPVSELRIGESREFTAPSGAKVVIARQTDDDRPEAFIALSSVCPHLGCRVFWELQNGRFFCPCHNGVFDPQGRPVSGPPAAAKQSLTRFPLRIENGLLFIEVPLEAVVATV